ncbi:MAG: type II toxin-antitoxin system PemK/MazF family toxin [Chloroflexi bacterium]|nr:type II toxin-antitoxin system PemK/MazF family toxin [Chloroflexota bacterium]
MVLVNYQFTDTHDVKFRPALVISADTYHRGRREAIVAAITSNIDRMLIGDYRLSQWREAGLLRASVVTGILRTIQQGMVARAIGTLSSQDMNAVDRNLRRCLGLTP